MRHSTSDCISHGASYLMWRDAVNLLLKKRERVTMGGKGRGEIGSEAGEVTGVVAYAPTTDGLGKRYGTFSGGGMAAGKVEVLLVVGGYDVDGCAEVRLVNKDVNC